MAKTIRREIYQTGFFGKVFRIIFFLFNFMMFFWTAFAFYVTFSVTGDAPSGDKGIAAAIGLVGITTIVSAWIGGGVILALLTYLTRGEKIIIEEEVADGALAIGSVGQGMPGAKPPLWAASAIVGLLAFVAIFSLPSASKRTSPIEPRESAASKPKSESVEPNKQDTEQAETVSGQKTSSNGITSKPSEEIQLQDGSKYIGEAANRLPNGRGTMTWPDGAILSGDFENGHLTHGRLTELNGDFIEGDFLQDKPSGKCEGKINGEPFTGICDGHERTGRGTLTIKEGGFFESRQKNGRTVSLRMDKGDRYVGEFDHNMFNGKGTLFASDGSIRAAGYWDHGVFIGKTRSAVSPPPQSPAVNVPQPAPSSGLPNFRVEEQCNKIASITGSRSETTYGTCMEMEQSAYDSLKSSWSRVPTEIQEQCEKIALVGGSGSYSTMKTCIEMELDAKRQNQQREFRR